MRGREEERGGGGVEAYGGTVEILVYQPDLYYIILLYLYLYLYYYIV